MNKKTLMNKELINKIISFFVIIEKKPLDNNWRLLHKNMVQLPFSGYKGALEGIYLVGGNLNVNGSGDACDKRETRYVKRVYNVDGTIDSKTIEITKKDKKTLELLLDEYYIALKKYIDADEAKYLNCTDNLKKAKMDKKIILMAAIISIVALAISLPIFVLTTYVGALMCAVSGFSLYKTWCLAKEHLNAAKDREFINSYKKYVECYANRDDVKRTLLKGYHSDKTKNNTTKRSSILNERSKELEPEVQKSSKLRYKYKSLVDTA